MGLGGILIYIFQMYIRPQDWLSFMYGFPIVVIIGSGLLIIAFFSLPQQNRPIMLPQVKFVIAYLVMIVLSNMLTGNGYNAFPQFVFYLKRSAIFFILIMIVDSPDKLKKIVSFMIIMNVILAVQAILQSKFGIMVPGQKVLMESRVAWVGAWDGPNITCMLFVTGAALSLGTLAVSYSGFWKAINIIFIGILTYAAYLTNSRGGYLALMLVFFLFMWRKLASNKGLVLKVIIALIFVFSVAVALKLGPSRMADLSTSESSAHERTWLWESSLNMFRSSPVFGIGKGEFKIGIYSSAHNNFAQNMAEMGFIGLFIYTALMYLSVKGVYLIRNLDPGKVRNRELIDLSNALFMCIIGFNAATFFITADLDILFAWIGLCAVAVNIARKEIEGFEFKFNLVDMGVIFMSSVAMIAVIHLISVKKIF